MLKRKIYPAYVLKHNSNRKNQAIQDRINTTIVTKESII